MMEKFAVDLDRVLDEFELNEDLESVGYQKNNKSDYVSKDIGSKIAAEVTFPKSSSSTTAFPPVDNLVNTPTLDLSEADFAPSSSLLSPISNINDTQQTNRELLDNLYFNSESNEEKVYHKSDKTSNSVNNDRPVKKSNVREVECLLEDFVGSGQNHTNSTIEKPTTEFLVNDSIKPLHYDETINKDYIISFGRKRDPLHKTAANINENSSTLTDCGIGNEEDGSIQTNSNVDEVLQCIPSNNIQNNETSEPEETFTTPDDGLSLSLLTDSIEPASFLTNIDVTDEDIQRYLENDFSLDESKLGFEDFYTPVTDTVLKENDLFGLENNETVSNNNQDNHDTSESNLATIQSSAVDESTEEINAVDENEVSIYDLEKIHEESSSADDDLNNPKIARPTSLHLPSKIQGPSAIPPSPDINEQDSALEDEEPNAFASLMATAGSPDAGLGFSPEDDVEGSSDPLIACSLSDLTEEERQVGKVAPIWVPDSEALNCMQCGIKFTVIRRRHHCRACGRVLCGNCCGLKAKITYMDNKEARVCQMCLNVISKVLHVEAAIASTNGTDHDGGRAGELSKSSISRGPNPNNPSEYCSLIPPLQQATPNLPPPTVMVPVGVLKRATDGAKLKGEPKKVMFSDGIRPGGDLTELDGPDQRPPYRRQGRAQKRVDRQGVLAESAVENAQSQVEYSINDNLDFEQILATLKDENEEPLVFVISRNLKVLVKIVDMTCCAKKTCWCITSHGMSAVGQDEIVILIEFLPDEQSLPSDLFHHMNEIYEEACKGSPVTHMGHSISSRPLFGDKDQIGFLYFRPTFQCLKKLPLPPPPFLFGVLLQKWEIPWAKVFPLRLLLRLGSEYRYYPCPLFGVRFRNPVFYEIGHTILNLLADFRNYQYSLPTVSGLVIHMKDGETTINFPRNRYDEVVKALNTGIDHVLAIAATFSTEADSHLVCIQNDQGNYQPQAISIDDKLKKVTGASFVVFNGALKTSSGITAKSAIIEDGVMVHIPAENMAALRQTLKDMKDYVIACGSIGAEKPDEVVRMSWVDDDKSVNIGVKSAIDGKPLDGVSSVRVHRGMDYVGDAFLIRWTEVYIIKNDTAFTSRSCDPTDVTKVSDTLAQACCLALAPRLSSLYNNGLTKIGLRITLDTDNVGYEIGANERVLPSSYMNDLDSELVPAIHSAASFHQEGCLILELVFHILQQ